MSHLDGKQSPTDDFDLMVDNVTYEIKYRDTRRPRVYNISPYLSITENQNSVSIVNGDSEISDQLVYQTENETLPRPEIVEVELVEYIHPQYHASNVPANSGLNITFDRVPRNYDLYMATDTTTTHFTNWVVRNREKVNVPLEEKSGDWVHGEVRFAIQDSIFSESSRQVRWNTSATQQFEIAGIAGGENGTRTWEEPVQPLDVTHATNASDYRYTNDSPIVDRHLGRPAVDPEDRSLRRRIEERGGLAVVGFAVALVLALVSRRLR